MNGIFRLFVLLSVTPFSQCSHHCIIMKFSEVITNDQSDVHVANQGLRPGLLPGGRAISQAN